MTKSGHAAAEVLVTVKTYPTPSLGHVETVCVAGVRMDTPVPEWIRLYPVPFRTMDELEQFKKYQVIRADVMARGTSDPRPESYSPDLSTLQLNAVIGTARGWSKRKQLLAHLPGATSTCELLALNRAAKMNESAPSLGLIKPEILDVTVEDGPPWKVNQLQKVEAAATPNLFQEGLKRLQPQPFLVRYRYRCADSGCRGHDQSVIDWELGTAGLSWQRQGNSVARVKDMILQKWGQQMTDATKDTHFFIGNQHQRRKVFQVLGVWWPPV